MVSTAQTGFLYDGVTPVQELTGSTVVSNLLTGLGIGEYLTRTDPSGASHFLSDALGGTVALTDSIGAVPTSYTYAPFGATSLSGSAIGNAFDYTSREDDGTGLKYYRARYYHPGLRRFISEDPIGFRWDAAKTCGNAQCPPATRFWGAVPVGDDSVPALGRKVGASTPFRLGRD